MRVTFDLSTDPTTMPKLMMGYTVFAGWDAIPAANVPTHLRVSLDKVEIHRAMDAADCRTTNILCASETRRQNQGGLPPGEWNLYWDVSGIWGQWGRADSDPASNGELLVNDGTVLTGNQSVDLYVPPGQGWRLFMHGRECDLGALGLLGGKTGDLGDCPSNQELADNNDVPGLILDTYTSAADALQGCVPDLPACSHRSNARTHKDDPTSTCPDPPANPEGCYSLTYSVSLVDDGASRTANPFAVPSGPGRLPSTVKAPPTPMTLALTLLLLVAGILVVAGRPRRATR